jgi:hypothetical protein
MQKQPAKRGAGRPKAIIDWEYVGKMLEAGGFATGIAATIGCDEATLYRRCELDNKVSFATFRQQKVAKGDEQLRVKQFKTAMSDRQGSVTMQIWLGKQRLGQSDKTENTHVGDINVNHTGEIAFAKALAKIYDIPADEIDRQTGVRGYIDGSSDNAS